MTPVASKVLATINAPYSVAVTPEQLAEKLADMGSASSFDAAAFAFLSEVSPTLQAQFLLEMGVERASVSEVAKAYSELAGYLLPLAA